MRVSGSENFQNWGWVGFLFLKSKNRPAGRFLFFSQQKKSAGR